MDISNTYGSNRENDFRLVADNRQIGKKIQAMLGQY